MKTYRRLLAAGTCAAALVAASPAGAAPVTSSPPLAAACDDGKTQLKFIPVPGSGPFTPFRVTNGQMFVPTSITVEIDPSLKARHLTPGVPAVKPGPVGSTTCEVVGSNADGTVVVYQATMIGNLVGKVTAP